MRQWSKSNVASIENTSVLRDLIQRQDIQLHELSAAVALLGSGRVPTATNTTTPGGGGVTDHGALTGLADDDHVQYFLLNGRASQQTVTTPSTTIIPLAIQGIAAQTADYIKVQSSSSTDVLRLLNTGVLRFGVSTAFLDISTTSITQSIAGSTPAFSILPDTYLTVQVPTSKYLFVGNGASGPTTPYSEYGTYIQNPMTGTGFAGLYVANSSTGTGPLQAWGSATGSATSNIVASLVNSGLMKARGFSVATTATGTVDIAASTATVTHALTLPSAQGASNSLLSNDGSGNLTWTTDPVLTGLTVVDVLWFTSSGGGDGYFDFSGVTSSGIVYTMPNGSGAVVIANATQTLQSKTLNTNCKVLCNPAVGVNFQDSATTTKQARLDLTGITAANTRTLKLHDVAGTVVLVGNTTSAAGVLGTSALTAQTGSIGATTLLTGGTSSAGMYRISTYLKTTTAGAGGDVVTMTVAWNDGAAQTLGMPFLTTGGAAANHDLATLNAHSQGSLVVYSAASQNITFTTTVTKTGSPQYSIYVRIEALG